MNCERFCSRQRAVNCRCIGKRTCKTANIVSTIDAYSRILQRAVKEQAFCVHFRQLRLNVQSAGKSALDYTVAGNTCEAAHIIHAIDSIATTCDGTVFKDRANLLPNKPACVFLIACSCQTQIVYTAIDKFGIDVPGRNQFF